MAISKFLDPKNDIAFRRIFGLEKNEDIIDKIPLVILYHTPNGLNRRYH